MPELKVLIPVQEIADMVKEAYDGSPTRIKLGSRCTIELRRQFKVNWGIDTVLMEVRAPTWWPRKVDYANFPTILGETMDFNEIIKPEAIKKAERRKVA